MRGTPRPVPAACLEPLEPRLALSAAFDITGLTALRADPAYGQIDGSGVGVAILDSGIYADHPDLKSNVVGWYDAVTPSNTQPKDPDGHGTHVSGTVGSSNPSIGVAPKARIVGVRVLPAENETQPSRDTVADGMRWVIDNYQQFGIKVVNMSLGSRSNYNGNAPAHEEATLIASLERLGITVVVASGNSYGDFASPGQAAPAVWATLAVSNTWEDNGVGDSAPVLASGSSDQYWAVDLHPTADHLAATSQRSAQPNQVAAPGSSIYSLYNGAGGKLYDTESGTSMAAPFVAGVVALMQDAAQTFGGRALSPAEVRDILRSTADVLLDSQNPDTQRVLKSKLAAGDRTFSDLPDSGQNYLRVNAQRAVARVKQVVTGATQPPPDTGAPDLDGTLAAAVAVPSLNGTQSYTYTGSIGLDGASNVGSADVDLFKLVLDSPGELKFTLSLPPGGKSFSPVLRVFNSAGAPIYISSPGSGYATLSTSALLTGTYYLGVSASANATYNPVTGQGLAPGGSSGDFSLQIGLTNPDPNGVIQGAVAYRGLPDTFNGYIGADYGTPVGSQDVDFFEVYLPDTGTLRIDIDAQDTYGSDAVDSYLRVFDENLNEIASNDDEVPGTIFDSLILLGPQYAQRGRRIFVAVSDYSNRNFSVTNPYDRTDSGSGGLYDLTLTLTNGDSDGTLATATPVTVGTPVSAAVGTDGTTAVGSDGSKDVDFYTITAAAPGVLDVQVSGGSGFQSGLIFWTFDQAANTATEIGRAYGAQSRLLVRVKAGDVVRASVTGLGNEQFKWYGVGTGTGGSTGSYTLTATLRTADVLAQFTDNSVQAATPTALSLDAPLSAAIGQDGPAILDDTDVDVFVFVAPFTGYVSFRADSSGGADAGRAAADTYLRVFDDAGNELKANDDANAATTGSKVVLPVTAGRTYYIGVNGYSPQGTAYNVLTGAGSAPGSTGAYAIVATQADIFIADPASRPGLAAGTDGVVVASALSASGRPIVFRTAGGADWTVTDLATKTGAPAGPGSPVVWIDPKDGLTYAATVSTSGSLLLFKLSGGQWSYRTLVGPANTANLTSNLAALIARDGTVYLGGVRSGGDFVLFSQTGGVPGGYDWNIVNLSVEQFTPSGVTTPAFTGPLVTYVTSWNGLNFAGLDALGDINSVWWAPGLPTWTTSNLTQITGAQRLAGGLTAYVTSWDNVSLVGATGAGEVVTTWWLPSFAGAWRTDSLTALFSGPTLRPESVTSYVTPWDSLSVAGLTVAGKLVIYWWAPVFGAGAAWQVAPISDLVTNPTPLVGAIRGQASPLQGAAQSPGPISITGRSATGDALRYFWSPDTNAWAQQNLSEIALPG